MSTSVQACPPPALKTGSAFKRIDTSLPGVCLIQPQAIRDPRGFFLESYHKAKFAAMGITDRFVQDNLSCSSKGILRGLHYQLNHPQAKLCGVVTGEVLDVAVDIRLGSPTFGKSASALLTAENHNLIYIPAGFAHGFLVLSESAQFFYKCSDYFDSGDEHGISWNDPGLNISWNLLNPVLSEKDRQLPPLGVVAPQFLPRYNSR
jgi:dTDP-4-dehydrorhamnose 3,5-epimerase